MAMPESRFRHRPGTRKGAAGRSEPRIMPGRARPGKPAAVESLICLNGAPPMTTRHAACHCGQLRATCTGEPVRVSMCHCAACQRRTGSVFGVQARFRADQVGIEGRSREYVRTGDSGLPVVQRFCPECGSTVWWTLDRDPGLVAIAVGMFADPGFPAPWVAVYEDCRHPWTELPALAGIEHHA
jgi:hypothetical protein